MIVADIDANAQWPQGEYIAIWCFRKEELGDLTKLGNFLIKFGFDAVIDNERMVLTIIPRAAKPDFKP